MFMQYSLTIDEALNNLFKAHITSDGKVVIVVKWDGMIYYAKYANIQVYFVYGFCVRIGTATSRL